MIERPLALAPSRRPSWPGADGDVVPIGDPDEDVGYGDDDDDEDEEEDEDDDEPWQVKETMSPADGPQGFLVIPANAGIQSRRTR
jgi:hypothetical protein